jgi:hypothetical protein
MTKGFFSAILPAVGAIFMAGCTIVQPDEVQNLGASATADGASVILSWSAPDNADGTETYSVYFDYTLLLDDIANLEYKHVSPGKTGQYLVTVTMNRVESGGDTVSTAPIDTSTITPWELNGSGESGIEFNISGLSVGTQSMDSSGADRSKVDCYFTNFLEHAEGFDSTYYLASPHMVSLDPGELDTTFTDWRVSAISGPLGGAIENVAGAPAEGYSDSTEVAVNQTYAVKTQDGYYGLIQVMTIDTTNGEIEIKTTFQPIQGLRWM